MLISHLIPLFLWGVHGGHMPTSTSTSPCGRLGRERERDSDFTHWSSWLNRDLNIGFSGPSPALHPQHPIVLFTFPYFRRTPNTCWLYHEHYEWMVFSSSLFPPPYQDQIHGTWAPLAEGKGSLVPHINVLWARGKYFYSPRPFDNFNMTTF